MSRVSIMLSGQDVTPHMVRDDFPEWIETSVKGAGWFDWTVKPFTFRLHQGAPVVPAYGQACRITLDGVERFAGVVDGIKDAFSKVPELTIQPPAVTLKDVMAGDPGVDPETNKERFLLEVRRPGLSIREFIELVLARYNQNRDQRIEPIDDWTVDVLGSEEDWLGMRAPHGLTGPEAGSAPANAYYADTLWRQYFRGYSAGVWNDGASRIDLGLNPMPTQRVGMLRRMSDGALFMAEWRPALYRVNSDTVALAANQVYRLAPLGQGGELDNSAGYTTSVEGNVSVGYVPAGYQWAGAESIYIQDSTVVSYVRRLLGISAEELLACGASADTVGGTWAAMFRRVPIEAPWGFEDRYYLVWWGNPLVQSISGRWHNESMVSLIKLAAMVSGRWVKFDGNHITLTPRSAGVGEVLLPDLGLAVDTDQQKPNTSPAGEITFQLIDWSDSGSTGIDFTTGQQAALNYAYVTQFSGVRIETEATWPVPLVPADIQLLADTTYGQVVELDWSVDGQLVRLKMMQEGQ